jgi:predicted flap endonuclease-1-like 5' DNA nuclease
MAKLVDIEGIGPKFSQKLEDIGIATTDRLLLVAAHKRGREDLSLRTDIPQMLILEWVNLADLMRIKGIGEEYSDLLEEAGVDTVKELRVRRFDNLHKSLREINAKKKLVRRLPSLRDVESWIIQARSLKPKVTH